MDVDHVVVSVTAPHSKGLIPPQTLRRSCLATLLVRYKDME